MSTPAETIIGPVLTYVIEVGMEAAARDLDLKPLHWSWKPPHTLAGQVGAEWDGERTASLVREWATALGLDEPQEIRPGMLEATGTIEDFPIQVWGVINRASFDQYAAEIDRRMLSSRSRSE